MTKKGKKYMNKGQAQQGFWDYEVSQQKLTRRREFLRQMQEVIPWKELEEECIRAGVYKANWGQRGRPSLPFRALLGSLFLQAWYGLSDPQTEEQIWDSVSFREFLGLGFSREGEVPDETTLCRFRNGLIRAGLFERIFERVKGEVERRGWLLKAGQVVDATIVKTAGPRVKVDETGQKEKQVYDAEAGYTKKREQVYYGYKVHIATDKRGWVCGVRTTSASVHDGQICEELLEEGVKELYGDSGYMSGRRELWCQERGIVYKAIRRRKRGEEQLPEEERKRNREIARERGIVELPFAVLKRWMGYIRCRFRGLEKNGAYHFLLMAAYNLKRIYGELRRGQEAYA